MNQVLVMGMSQSSVTRSFLVSKFKVQKVNKFDSSKLVQAEHVCVKMIIIILRQYKR